MRCLFLAVLVLSLVLAPPSAATQPPQSTPSPAPTPAPDHAAVVLLKRWARAVEARDFEELDRLWARDAVIFISGRATVGWPEYRDRHLRPQLGRLQDVRYSVDDIAGRGDEAMAWLIFRFRLTATVEGQALEGRGVGTAVVQREADGWRIVHLHTSTPIAVKAGFYRPSQVLGLFLNQGGHRKRGAAPFRSQEDPPCTRP